MSVYFLHLRERDHFIWDPEGTEFEDLPTAQAEARQAIRDIVAEHLVSDQELRLSAIEIFNDTGKLVATVSLAASISAVIPVSEDAFNADLSRR